MSEKPKYNPEVEAVQRPGQSIDITLPDSEIEAMRYCAQVLAQLGDEARLRVLRYLNDRWPVPEQDGGRFAVTGK
jgi:hypothetical protein